MAYGRKTGGRTKGTPNKRSNEVTDRLAAIGRDPIEGLAMIALNQANTVEIRLRAFAELAPYVEARRRSIEARIDSRHSVQIQVSYADVLRGIDETVFDQVDNKNVVPLMGDARPQ